VNKSWKTLSRPVHTAEWVGKEGSLIYGHLKAIIKFIAGKIKSFFILK
jgi:hypothetical protein